MLRKLGARGIVGIVILVAGIGLIAYDSPIVAGGIALVLAGLGIVVQSLLSNVLRSFGML